MIPNIREFICGSDLRTGCYVICTLMIITGILSAAAGYQILQDEDNEYQAGYLRYTKEWCWSRMFFGGSLVFIAVLVGLGTFLGRSGIHLLRFGAIAILFTQFILLLFFLGYYVLRERYYDIYFSVSGFGLFTYFAAVMWSHAKGLAELS